MNSSKLVDEDEPLFDSLINDLFPNLVLTKLGHPRLEEAIQQTVEEESLTAHAPWLVKIIQLFETQKVRHGIMVIGPSGAGKSNCISLLAKALSRVEEVPVKEVKLNPKAITDGQMFGKMDAATNDWSDGIFSSLWRRTIKSTKVNWWLILDGPVDPHWIENLNSVLDDNKILTLASNERIALTPTMKLLFEISNLRTATPATVSRAGILYINPEDLGWNPYVTSWVERRENAHEKTNLTILFDKYTPGLQAIIKNKFKKITPIPGINHVKMLCSLLEAVITPANIPQDAPRELYELYFVFVAVWSYGSALFHDGQSDFRAEFSKWFTHEFKSVKFPLGMSVFDVWVDPVAGMDVKNNCFDFKMFLRRARVMERSVAKV